MTEDLRISMIQSHIIWEDREENLGYYGELLRRVSGRTDLAVLPETFTTGFSMDVEKQADTMDGRTVPTIKEWAKKYKLAVAGSFIAKDNGKFYNRAFFITPEGEEYYYDKRHLFRMAEEDKHFSAGDKRLIVPYKGWNICLQVCYDLRFPVWSRNVNNEYDLLIYVANLARGPEEGVEGIAACTCHREHGLCLWREPCGGRWERFSFQRGFHDL